MYVSGALVDRKLIANNQIFAIAKIMNSNRHHRLFSSKYLSSIILICLIIALIFGENFQFHLPTISAQNLVSQPISGYVDVDRAKIFYRIFGEGKPLLLINGGPGFPSNHFVPLAQELSKNNRQVIIFDQRGTGRSLLPQLDSETVNLKLMIEDIEALRNHLQISNWTLMGHSFGGVLAMSYAVRYPDRVDSIILSASGGIDLEFHQYIAANIAVRLSPSQRILLDYWSKKIRKNEDTDRAIQERLKINLSAYVFYPENRSTIIKSLTETSKLVPVVNDLVWNDLKKQNYNLASKLKDFQKPVLILQGRQDFLGESTAIKINEAIANSELIFINECGHSIWLDRKDKYFNSIAKFLEKTAS
jgi:proline iminopeptidase